PIGAGGPQRLARTLAEAADELPAETDGDAAAVLVALGRGGGAAGRVGLPLGSDPPARPCHRRRSGVRTGRSPGAPLPRSGVGARRLRRSQLHQLALPPP